MKKILGMIALLVVCVIPMTVKAAQSTKLVCGAKETSGDVTTMDCHIELTSDAAVTSLEGSLTLTNVALTSAGVSAEEGWSSTGSGTTISLIATGTATSYTNAKIASFTVTVDTSKSNCKVVFTPTAGTTCTDCTYEDDNPKTGSAVPYIVIGSLAILAGAVYVTTRKNTKLFKI